MKYIAGGVFAMGSSRFYPEEAPVRQVRVDPFWIDEAPVTNAQFAEFVSATGHVTFAEISPSPDDYPGLSPELAHPGSLIFEQPAGALDHVRMNWWQFRVGADWRHPLGPSSDLSGLEDHPVVHIAWSDAVAFAAWADKSLPTEAEWEFAAKGGMTGADFAWGEELAPGGKMLANYWQGPFPVHNSLADGWERTSPVGYFPANGYGLYDMIGNVWEWTADWFGVSDPDQAPAGPCCVAANPRGGCEADSRDPAAAISVPRKVIKGGSHLCAENYCRRYRPAARFAQPIDTTTGHVGFRCVRRAA
ncbi:MAG: gliding motility-associated lipoprotein GldK [Sphingopyxis macrogoltabida]|uniref:Gliding motility-associated lipoprotein GldK n=1 Tax=Sphingopyxis macrogoltabida TaxID=33050 RepID=A0A2W5N8P8_SPHMC|nr:MAG: gliding motility-associated lipoprotein GldK [Sphingopyxis macrogoltabida]